MLVAKPYEFLPLVECVYLYVCYLYNVCVCVLVLVIMFIPSIVGCDPLALRGSFMTKQHVLVLESLFCCVCVQM